MRSLWNAHLKKILKFAVVMNAVCLVGNEAQGMDYFRSYWQGKQEDNRPKVTLILLPNQQLKETDNVLSRELSLDLPSKGEPRHLKSQRPQPPQTPGSSYWASNLEEAMGYLPLFDGSFNVTLSIPATRTLDDSWSEFFRSIQCLDAIEDRSGWGNKGDYTAPFFKVLLEGLGTQVKNLSCYDFWKWTSCDGPMPYCVYDGPAFLALAKLFNQSKVIQKVNLGLGFFPSLVSEEETMTFLKSLEGQPQLTYLGLDYLPLTSVALAEQLARVVQQATALQTLHFSAMDLGSIDKGLIPLCNVLKNHPTLTELTISMLTGDCESVSALLTNNSKIQKLDIHGFSLSLPAYYKILGEGLSNNKSIREFECFLWGDVKSTEEFFQGMRGNRSLKKVAIEGATLNEEGAQYLGEFVTKNTSLEDLTLTLLTIGDEQATFLLNVLLTRATPLKSFSFFYNGSMQGHATMWIPLIKRGTVVKFLQN